MARVAQAYPTPIHGVSTLAPRNRAKGQAAAQINMRSDPVNKLTRRPPLTWDAALAFAEDTAIAHHSYYRKGKRIRLVIEDDGTVNAFIDNQPKPLTGTLGSYRAGELAMATVNDTTFVVNKDKVVQLSTDTDANTIQKAVHINVLHALNYSTTLTVTVSDANDNVLGTSTITVGDGIDDPRGSLAAHDAARAVNTVATKIAEHLAAIAGITTVAKGSSVAIQYDDNSVWPKVTVEGGRGDDVVVISETVANIEGLPLYAIPGTRITVKPDPVSKDGTYYLEAVTLEGENTGGMQEVVWDEARSPNEPYKFDASTMPHTVVYDNATDSFTVGPATWSERRAGDNESCPVPSFVGRRLNAVSQFQKRLVLLSENDVAMTRTDNFFNWWKKSAVQLLVTDPIEVTSNATGIDELQYVVEHNRDLMIVASNGQFKIDGTTGITPQTVAMPLTTSHTIQTTVAPVSMGTSVYMPITYGDSTGVIQYTGKRDQGDAANQITHHVIGYMKGNAKLFAGSPNLEMLAMTTTGAAPNELFIYEQFTQEGSVGQQAWSKWVIPDVDEIVALDFTESALTLIVANSRRLYAKTFNMYSRVATNTHEVYLDNLIELDTNGTTVTLPFQYTWGAETLVNKLIVVMGSGTIYPLESIGYTRHIDVLTFNEDIGAGKVYVGLPFTSSYEPTRPFIEDGSGIVVTTDRVRISRFVLNVVDTERVRMKITSDYYDYEDQEMTPRVLGSNKNLIGTVDLYTGDYKFSYSQDADLATATFYTDGYLGMTIAGISWEGQYRQSSRRL